MMMITKEVELTTAGKVALIEARLNHVRGLNRVYDFRSRAKGYYTDLSRVMADIVTQEEIKKQIRIFEQQVKSLKSHIQGSPVGLSLEEQLLVNQQEQQMYAHALEVFKHEWETNKGDYKAMCYNQIEAINKRIAYLSKIENTLVEQVIGIHEFEKEMPVAPQGDVLLVDRNVLEGTLKQLGVCDTHIQHAINIMTVKAVG